MHHKSSELSMGIQAKIIAIIALVALSAFFSGVETALFSLSRLRAKYLARKGVHGASAVEKLKENPQKLLITILIGNNIMNVAAASLATSVAYDLSVSYAISLTTGIMTLILLIFGEITPKSISSKNSEKISLAVADLIRIIQILLFPIIIIFDY